MLLVRNLDFGYSLVAREFTTYLLVSETTKKPKHTRATVAFSEKLPFCPVAACLVAVSEVRYDEGNESDRERKNMRDHEGEVIRGIKG